MNDIIALDVGGTRFDTTRQTLLQDPNSMLAKMFDPNSPLTPGLVKNGAYFLDRDPEYFRFILNYLRNGVLLADTRSCMLFSVKPDTSACLVWRNWFSANLNQNQNNRLNHKIC